MRVGLLGPLVLEDGSVDGLNPRDRVVLAALAVHPGESLSREQLADALWGDRPPASWDKNLQGCVVRIRRALGADAVETVPHGYRLAVEPTDVDAFDFAQRVARGRELLALGEPERAAYQLERALHLWRGRPLDELAAWEPGDSEASRLEGLREDARDWWLEARLRSGGHEEVLSTAEAMVREAPVRERRWQMLATAQYRSGRQAEALETLRRARVLLSEELGLDPGPDLAALELAVLRQAPELDLSPEPEFRHEACPWPGLASYDVRDAESFFGRERETREALRRLGDRGVLMVVGPSGCGKSSFVRAGVAAALCRAGRQVTVVAPGPHPLSALPPARSHGCSALVVDQAEEAFTLCADEAERAAFWGAVGRHASAAPVVVAMRADRMGDVASEPQLARLAERGLFLLGGMTGDELRSAVLHPADQHGYVLEPGLVDLLLREVEGEAGALPLLSHALSETWNRREGRVLTVAGYRDSGGIQGAVAQSAEEVYAELAPDTRDALRDVMLRLVLLTGPGDPVRARVPRRVVAADASREQLLDRLVGARLLTSEDGVVTLAHEALARSWPRLRAWLEEDAAGQRVLHHLSAAADSWDALGRPSSELYRGVRLAQVLEWASGPHPELTAVEREFLEQSEAHALGERREAEARARAQARMIRRLRASLVGAAVLVLVAALAGSYAFRQQAVAERRGDAARTAELAAVAGRAGARALSTDDVDTSLLVAATAARLHQSSATRANLLAALGKRPELVGAAPVPGAGVRGLAVSPDGDLLAVRDHDGRVRVLETGSGAVVGDRRPASDTVPPIREQVGPVTFHPDGDLLAVGAPAMAPRPLNLLDGDGRRAAPAVLPGTTGPHSRQHDLALSLAFDGAGDRLAATFYRIGPHPWPDDVDTWEAMSAAVAVWDTSTPTSPRLLMRAPLPGRAYELRDRNVVEIAPDGRRVYTSRPLSAYDVGTGRKVWSTDVDGYVMDLSPDGRTLVVDDEADLLVVDVRTGRVLRTLHGHRDMIVAVAFAPDGRSVATTGRDGTGMVWDPATGAVRQRFELGENNVRGLAFAADSRSLYAGGDDAVVRRWDVTGRTAFLARVLPPKEFGFGWVLEAPGGLTAAHMVANRGTRFVDLRTGRTSDWVGPAVGFSDGSWNRAGDRFVSGGGARVQIWTPDGELVRDNRDHRLSGRVWDLDFTGDETGIVVTEEDGTVLLLDARTFEPLGRPFEAGEQVCCVSAAGSRRALVLIGGPPEPAFQSYEFEGPPRTWALLDVVTGELVRSGRLEVGGWGAEISPDGSTAAISMVDGRILFVDLATGDALRPAVRGHFVPCCQMAWSPDSATLVASAVDGSVSVWAGRTGELLGRVQLPEKVLSGIELLRDGHTVSVATYTDAVYLWDTSVETALDYACGLAGRNLTHAEWATYFEGQPYRETCAEDQLTATLGGLRRPAS